MAEIELCERCGVPLIVGSQNNWDSSGVISITGLPRNRMVFLESENIDDLFRGIEELIGLPIEHIVVERKRRETRRYTEDIYPSEIRGVRSISGEDSVEMGLLSKSTGGREILEMVKESNVQLNKVARIYGYGDVTLSGKWESRDDYPWRTQYVRNPYSLLFYAADALGSVEAFEDMDMRVEYEEIGDDCYRVTSYPGDHAIELKERLKRKRYDIKPGDIRFARCPGCGIPSDMSRCRWDLESGMITDLNTGRRKALFGPASFDAIFEDLEAELGETVPETIIEAQRRYIKSEMRKENWRRAAPDFRHMIALNGLGNTIHFEAYGERLTMTIENSCLHLTVVGTVKALFELAMGKENSTHEWNIAEDGVLTLTVKG